MGMIVKRLSLCFILLLLLTPLFSEVQYSSTDLLLTGIKYGGSGGSPDKLLQIRVLDYSNSEIGTNSVVIPINARNATGDGIPLFSWILNGNIFQTADITFTIEPLTYTTQVAGLNNQMVDKYYYLPYTITFVCGNSKVGNFTIPYNSTPMANGNFYLLLSNTTYTYHYADKIEEMTGVSSGNLNYLANCRSSLTWDSADSQDQSMYIRYNMSKVSEVYIGGNQVLESAYPLLCNHWNRTGTAYVKLNIGPDGSYTENGEHYLVESGQYESSVTINITEI